MLSRVAFLYQLAAKYFSVQSPLENTLLTCPKLFSCVPRHSLNLVFDRVHFLGVFEQVFFSKIAFTSALHTALDEAWKGRVVVNATHVRCALALDPERTLLLGTVGPSAIELRRTIIVTRVVNTMIRP